MFYFHFWGFQGLSPDTGWCSKSMNHKVSDDLSDCRGKQGKMSQPGVLTHSLAHNHRGEFHKNVRIAEHSYVRLDSDAVASA